MPSICLDAFCAIIRGLEAKRLEMDGDDTFVLARCSMQLMLVQMQRVRTNYSCVMLFCKKEMHRKERNLEPSQSKSRVAYCGWSSSALRFDSLTKCFSGGQGDIVRSSLGKWTW
jgi:hypothetical protein